MSRQEVVNEYLSGRIDRREFIRRLSIAGVSTAAAVAYAQSLSSGALAAPSSQGRAVVVRAQDYLTQTATADSDDDGFTDDEEEECGSDPNDPNSTCDNVGTVTPVTTGTATGTLPNTGAGDVSEGGSSWSWLAPLAAAGAGATYLARGFRRTPKTDV